MAVQGLLGERPAMVCQTRAFAVATEVSRDGVPTAIAISSCSSAVYRAIYMHSVGHLAVVYDNCESEPAKIMKAIPEGKRRAITCMTSVQFRVTGTHVTKFCLLRKQWEYEIQT